MLARGLGISEYAIHYGARLLVYYGLDIPGSEDEILRLDCLSALS
jgi:hypothetical protein